MQFSIATAVAILAGFAVAGPVVTPEVYSREVGASPTEDTSKIEEAISFAAHPDASCSFTACASVLAKAACIAAALESGNIGALEACVSGGKTKLCQCATCIPKLGPFLNKKHIC
ncbi:hypothetical protein PG999_008316 [Apiospora kogelbergensis]|uniref:Fungal calcium binding protein domain-containing protein n=1 Tax=Apiospora kogelbergensis TaxID=1337665 RepID=A0AAW0QG07_9PEZI